jgi:glutaredoxin
VQREKVALMGRKVILFVDDSNECEKARKFLRRTGIDFVEYNVKDKDRLESGCCDGFTTEVPSIFAPEGIYKGITEIKKYAKMRKEKKQLESESAYW